MTDPGTAYDQKFGRIAGNRSIDAMIYRCFEHIHERDARAFVRLFRSHAVDGQQILHTFRELVLGGFLGSRGLRMRYNLSTDNQTPDWSRVSATGDLEAIVELVNFHPPRVLEQEIDTAARTGVWVGRMPTHSLRLRSSLEDKVAAYRVLAEGRRIPYVISVFSEFTADVEPDELRECLFHSEHGLFVTNPIISGVMFFEERLGVYQFQFIANPRALYTIVLPDGDF